MKYHYFIIIALVIFNVVNAQLMMDCMQSADVTQCDSCSYQAANSPAQCGPAGDGCASRENDWQDSASAYTQCLCLRAQPCCTDTNQDCCCNLCHAVCDIVDAACHLVDCLSSCPADPPCNPVKNCGVDGAYSNCCDQIYNACIAGCDKTAFDASQWSQACTSALGQCLNNCGSQYASDRNSANLEQCAQACIYGPPAQTIDSQAYHGAAQTLSVGAIVGISIGSIVALAVVIVLLVKKLKKDPVESV